MRSEFDEWAYNNGMSRTRDEEGYFSKVTQAASDAWQHLQSKIDKLQANFDQHDQWLGQRNRDVQELNDIIAKHAAEKNELQKRVDAALKITSDNLQYVSQNHRDIFKPLLMTMIRSFKELEQALKGDSNG